MDNFVCQSIIQQINEKYHNCDEMLYWKKELENHIKGLNDNHILLKNYFEKIRYRDRKYEFYENIPNYLVFSSTDYNDLLFCLNQILFLYQNKSRILYDLKFLYKNMIEFENRWCIYNNTE